MNAADAVGLRFECLPGCGFCCTARPLVQPHEAPALGPRVVRTDDGTLRIPLSGPACGALQPDRGCGVYAARPAVCKLYPYQVHAGRRLQVTVSLACPGVGERGEDAEPMAVKAAELALAQPGAAEMAAKARATFAEFDRRMKEWDVAAPPDKLRAAFLPHVATLARPGALPAFFAGIESGDLVLGNNASNAIEGLFASEADALVADLFAGAAIDAFDEPENVLWVEPDLTWTRLEARDERITLHRGREKTTRRTIDVAALDAEWSDEASEVLAKYLARLLHRDHTEGAAAWLVDASEYQATPAAAFARVVGEASLQVALRATLLAADEERDVVDAALARRGVSAYETSYHSLPTLGSIL